jgi:hypothetical protein
VILPGSAFALATRSAMLVMPVADRVMIAFGAAPR